VLEDTGIVVGPATLRIVAVETTPDRQHNPRCCQSLPSSVRVHSSMSRRSRRSLSTTNRLKLRSFCTPTW
jgi:hypothetical protein